MSDHNLSARLWATAALFAVPLASATRLGWWLPLHLALLGAVSQAIVGGQLMFSTTLGLSRGPTRASTTAQLALLNMGAALVIGGRWFGITAALGAGASAFVVAVAWATWQVNRMWRHSVNRRFAVTGTFYTLAGVSVMIGATIGGALGLGAFEAVSYVDHRSVHMIFNVFGWAGMTIIGTATTLLPTILHVRAPDVKKMRPVPWFMFTGLVVAAAGMTLQLDLLAGLGMVTYVGGMAPFAMYAKQVLGTPRRRRIPTAAFHLIAASAWALASAAFLVVATTQGDHAVVRNLVVVGGAGGFALQALLGAWSFLLPSTRAPIPQKRRHELIAMETGGKIQVIAYNLGLLLVAADLLGDIDVGIPGIALVSGAAAWALLKSWIFPAMAQLGIVQQRSEEWWADPEQRSG